MSFLTLYFAASSRADQWANTQRRRRGIARGNPRISWRFFLICAGFQSQDRANFRLGVGGGGMGRKPLHE